MKTLTRRRHAAGVTGSARRLPGAPAQQAPPLPLYVRLARPLTSALREVSLTLHADGAARASLRASRYSVALLAAAVAADIVFIISLVALGSILSTGLSEQIRDVIIFILLLPVLLAMLLSLAAALAAAGLAIYAIFKRGEKPLTIAAALLAAAALLFGHAIFGALLLRGE